MNAKISEIKYPKILDYRFCYRGIINRQNGDGKLLKVLVPTPPKLTSGTMVVVIELKQEI